MAPAELISTLEESLERLKLKATDPDNERVDVPVERQIQNTASLIWQMLKDTGSISPYQETAFELILTEFIPEKKDEIEPDSEAS
jgi:hypothetical protein